MDVCKVTSSYQGGYYEEAEYEVAAVGWETQCFNCGGWGHQSRECPSENRQQRDSKGHNKGAGNVGHKAWECRGGRPVGSIEEEGDADENVPAGSVETVPISTVWKVGAVEMRVADEGFVEEIQTDWNVGAVHVQAADAVRIEVDRKPKRKNIEITVDSGAGANCWPQGLLQKVPMQPKAKGVRFRAANGTELKYYGTKNIQFMLGGGDGV